MRQQFPAGLPILFAALLAGSSGALAGPPGLDDARGDPLIRISAISPQTSTRLTLGETVNVEVTVAYILHDKAGKLALVVSDTAKHAVAETSMDIAEGRGETTLRVSFVVPATKMLMVKAFLTKTDLKPFARDERSYTHIFVGPLAPNGSNAKRKSK